MGQLGGEIKMRMEGLNPDFSFHNGGESILQTNLGLQTKQGNEFETNYKKKGSSSLNNLNTKANQANGPAAVANTVHEGELMENPAYSASPPSGASAVTDTSKYSMDRRRNWIQNRNKSSSNDAIPKQKSPTKISASDVQQVSKTDLPESPVAATSVTRLTVIDSPSSRENIAADNLISPVINNETRLGAIEKQISKTSINNSFPVSLKTSQRSISSDKAVSIKRATSMSKVMGHKLIPIFDHSVDQAQVKK
jgi:hypothetical protein